MNMNDHNFAAIYFSAEHDMYTWQLPWDYPDDYNFQQLYLYDTVINKWCLIKSHDLQYPYKKGDIAEVTLCHPDQEFPCKMQEPKMKKVTLEFRQIVPTTSEHLMMDVLSGFSALDFEDKLFVLNSIFKEFPIQAYVNNVEYDLARHSFLVGYRKANLHMASKQWVNECKGYIRYNFTSYTEEDVETYDKDDLLENEVFVDLYADLDTDAVDIYKINTQWQGDDKEFKYIRFASRCLLYCHNKI